jgi:hypothetical protein
MSDHGSSKLSHTRFGCKRCHGIRKQNIQTSRSKPSSAVDNCGVLSRGEVFPTSWQAATCQGPDRSTPERWADGERSGILGCDSRVYSNTTSVVSISYWAHSITWVRSIYTTQRSHYQCHYKDNYWPEGGSRDRPRCHVHQIYLRYWQCPT